jgi:hypothetical protein
MSSPQRPVPALPVLALILNIFGGLTLLGAVAVIVGAIMQFKSTAGSSVVALPIAGGLVFCGMLYLAAAEIIQLVARMAIEAGRMADATEQHRGQRQFLYHIGNDIRGPVSLDFLRTLRAVKGEARLVTGETLVCPVGEADWKRLADFMDKPAPEPAK